MRGTGRSPAGRPVTLLPMTFSIVAHCARTGQFGVAATTQMPAVGKLLAHARAGVGAVATQARINPNLGIDGIALLAVRLTADATIEALRCTDPHFDRRQLAVVDRWGGTAAWTGPDCLPWAGAITRDGWSVQGNRLTGPDVLDALDAAMAASVERPLADRLIDALEAGDACGGDRKGENSATIYVVDTEDYPLWDIRVDHHPHPMHELRRLHGVFCRELLPEMARMPTRADPGGSAAEHDA